jgi:hypothetical protein
MVSGSVHARIPITVGFWTLEDQSPLRSLRSVGGGLVAPGLATKGDS